MTPIDKTLDEIEADVREVIDHYNGALHEPPRVALESIVALVGHVRALKQALDPRPVLPECATCGVPAADHCAGSRTCPDEYPCCGNYRRSP